ncbi:MAG TPA: AAA family ATPase [Nitrososphaeraceae archaeon]|nr:AAA family ATPase [Nitrososphaeraceae archaeon]
MKKQHTLWVERYRIINIDEYICKDELREKLKQYFKENDIPNMLFAGKAGTGKTTLAKLIVANLGCDSLFLNASDENGVDTIREKVKTFASSASFKPLKVIILDEADFLTQEAQAALRNIIEEFSLKTRFILTCNYLEKIIEPLQSRCQQGKYKLDPPTKAEVARFITTNILDKEGVTYNLKEVAEIINAFYPDIRSIIGTLQKYTKDKTLIFKKENLLEVPSFQILEILKKPTKTSFYDIRKIVANAEYDDFQPLYRFLFDNLSEFSQGLDADMTITIDEYVWKSRIVPDKEINISACFANILNILKNNKLLKS